ncbi:MAG: CoA ester lyase [Ahrensia sp.]|nr:CoA ester lyase [Ahrensia sp.]
MTIPRSYLFVPGHRPDRFAKAASSGAHRIIIDLEDAVGPAEKEIARVNVADWFKGGGTGMVRINSTETPWFEADLDLLAGLESASVMVPKAAGKSLSKVGEALPGRSLIALVESVDGLVGLGDVASASGVSRLAFGNFDFSTDARIPGTGSVLDPARFQIVIASRHAGLEPPIDGVTAGFGDDEELQSDIHRVRQMGFTAKLCIHPRQVELVNKGFSPTDEEIAWAQRIVAADRASGGAVTQVDGKMVDRPMIERANTILSEGADS